MGTWGRKRRDHSRLPHVWSDGRFVWASITLLLVVACMSWAAGIKTPAGIVTVDSAWSGAPRSDCTSCHAMAREFSHPVDFTPRFALPSEFPLFDGEMTCATCHTDCGDRVGVAEADHAKLLRAVNPEVDFCHQCHDHDRVGGSRSPHFYAMGRAHLSGAIERGLRARSSRSRSGNGELDDPSARCLSCHDGTVAQAAGHDATPASGEHPVGNNYPAPLRARRQNLVPATDLDARIHLPDGRVSCTSCHSLYSRHEGLLVMPNDGSALCLSCHAY